MYMHMYLYMYNICHAQNLGQLPIFGHPVGSRRSSAVSASEAASRGRWPPPLGCASQRRRSTRRCRGATGGTHGYVIIGNEWGLSLTGMGKYG